MSDQRDDPSEEFVDNPDPGATYDLPAEDGQTPELAQLRAEYDARLADLQGKADNTQTLGAIAALLQQQNKPADTIPFNPVQPKMPNIDLAAAMAKFNENQFKGDAAKELIELIAPVIDIKTAPLRSQLDHAIKQNLYLHPDTKDVMAKYGAEVERQANALAPNGPDSNAWHTACNMVKVAHLDDILATEKQKWLAEMGTQPAPAAPVVKPAVRPSPGFGGGTGTPSGTTKAPATADDVIRHAAKKFGTTPEHYLEFASARAMPKDALADILMGAIQANKRPAF